MKSSAIKRRLLGQAVYEIRMLGGWCRLKRAWIEPSGWLGYRLPNGDTCVVPPDDYRIMEPHRYTREEALALALQRWFVRPLAVQFDLGRHTRCCAWCHGAGRYRVNGLWVTCKCALRGRDA